MRALLAYQWPWTGLLLLLMISACGRIGYETQSEDQDAPGTTNNCSTSDAAYVVDSSCGVGYCQSTNTPSSCTAGVETLCTPGSPLSVDDATCDGVDDNCNGVVDEDGTSCPGNCPDSCNMCSGGGCCSDICGASCSLSCPASCTCNFDCTGAVLCKPNCSVGSECHIDCTGATTCDVKCAGSRCDIVCPDSTSTCKVDCKLGEICNVNCANGSTCDLSCDGTLSCDFNCSNVTGTCAAQCKNGAACLLDCTGAASCGFSTCSGGSGETLCPGNVVVCNRPCP